MITKLEDISMLYGRFKRQSWGVFKTIIITFIGYAAFNAEDVAAEKLLEQSNQQMTEVIYNSGYNAQSL